MQLLSSHILYELMPVHMFPKTDIHAVELM